MSVIDEFLIEYNKKSADYKAVKEYAHGVVETALNGCRYYGNHHIKN